MHISTPQYPTCSVVITFRTERTPEDMADTVEWAMKELTAGSWGNEDHWGTFDVMGVEVGDLTT
jgi:hypothetical protein